MTELYHVGIDADDVPAIAVIAEHEFADITWPSQWRPRELPSRRELSSLLLDVDGTHVLVCCGAFGAPAAVIALEELVRAGARDVLGLAVCRCRACRRADGSGHPVVLASGAERCEATSADYAPLAYPAVPDADLLRALRHAFAGDPSVIVRTVDVLAEWLDPNADADGDEAVDLMTSAVFVAAAAKGAAACSVLVGAERRREDAAVRAITALAGVRPKVAR